MVIYMKKLSAVILVFAVVLSAFTACSGKNDSASPPEISTTIMDEVATSYINQSAEGKTVVYETSNRETLRLDICNPDGSLKYTEEYLYDQFGSVYGYTYYNKDGVFVASYLFAGEKTGYFNEDGSPMHENEFSQKMDVIGVVGS